LCSFFLVLQELIIAGINLIAPCKSAVTQKRKKKNKMQKKEKKNEYPGQLNTTIKEEGSEVLTLA
jgi:hypothetical protein